MTYNDLATQLKQIHITQPKSLRYWTETFRIWSNGLFDIIKETYHHLAYSNLTQLAMTYNDLVTQLKTNIYNSAKILDIQLELSVYDQIGY